MMRREFLDVALINVDGVGDDSASKRVVLVLEVVDLLRRSIEFVQRRRSGRAKRVMRVEQIAVVEVDLTNGRLRDEVEDVGTRPAEADDDDLRKLELICDGADAGAARSRVQVPKNGTFLVRGHGWESFRRDRRVERTSVSLDHRDVRRHLFVVVGIAG